MYIQRVCERIVPKITCFELLIREITNHACDSSQEDMCAKKSTLSLKYILADLSSFI